MTQWIHDGLRWIGWMIYASMNYFISQMYDSLMLVPSMISKFIDTSEINNLVHATENLFFMFAGLIMVVGIVSRFVDFDIKKLFDVIKKLFILTIMIIALPWIFRMCENITNELIIEANNLMQSEMNSEADSIDYGVILGNIYVYKNKEYVGLDGYDEYSEDPFSSVYSIDEDYIINATIKDEEGEKVYVYSYLNPILGIVLNLFIIIMIMISAFKVFGYILKLMVIKIFTPIRMIFAGFSASITVGELIMDIVGAFISIILQIITIELSTFFLIIITSQIDNLFLNMMAILASLFFMLDGSTYIQDKFATDTGISSVLGAYTMLQATKAVGGLISKGVGKVGAAGADTIKGSVESFKNKEPKEEFNSGVKPDEKTLALESNNDIGVNENSNDKEEQNNDINMQNTEEDKEGTKVHGLEEVGEAMNNDKGEEISENIQNKDEEIKGNIQNNEKGGEMKDNIQSVEKSSLEPTDKQKKLAQAYGIEIEGRNRYQLGNDIEKALNSGNYKEPVYDKSKSLKVDDLLDDKLNDVDWTFK